MDYMLNDKHLTQMLTTENQFAQNFFFLLLFLQDSITSSVIRISKSHADCECPSIFYLLLHFTQLQIRLMNIPCALRVLYQQLSCISAIGFPCTSFHWNRKLHIGPSTKTNNEITLNCSINWGNRIYFTKFLRDGPTIACQDNFGTVAAR